MPLRKSNRTAAVAANNAIASEFAEPEAASKPKRPAGRPKRSAAVSKPEPTTRPTTTRTKKSEASHLSEDQRPSSPIRRTPVKTAKPELAPPDTLCISRRSRTRMRGGSPPAKPEPKARRSPRAGRARTKAPPSTSHVEVDVSEGDEQGGHALEDIDSSYDEHGFSDEALPETPTKHRGKVTPLFPPIKKQQRVSARDSVVVDVVGSSSPKPAPGRRGRKRKSGILSEGSLAEPKDSNGSSVHQPPSKRGRVQKTSEVELADESEASAGAAAEQIGEVYVDIVSPSKFETSRSKLRTTRKRSDKAADTTSGGDNWRAKYEELLELRQSQPEKEYEEFRAKAQERFDAAEDVIGNLRKEVAELKLMGAQQSDSAASSKAVEAASEAAAAVEARVRKAIESEFEKQLALLRQQVEALTQDVLVKDEAIERLEKHRRLTETSTDYNLRQKLKVMEEITGLAIGNVETEDEGLSFVCKQSVGAGVAARYVLTLLDDLPDDYQYDPISDDSALAMLPSYLQEHISFERRFGSMFFWRMCNLLRQSRQSPPAGANGEPAASSSQPLAKSGGPGATSP